MAQEELTWKVSIDPAIAKAALADVRREVAQTVQATQNANKSELSMRQQLAAAASLQRQRSAALIAEWKRTEKAAADLARGVAPVKDNLQQVVNIMQTLGGASATLQGPMGGVASRLRSIGSLAGEAAGGLGIVGVAAGVAVVALAALGVGAAAVAKEFIDLTLSTVEWEDQLDDLSAATGVSVETLSALQIITKSTGGDIESISTSVTIFQSKMEEAQDPTSKMATTFKQLGIETNNTEDAFRQAFKALSDMGEGFRQTAAARELFGRSGTSVLAIIKETNGNLDEAITKLRKMGLVLSEEDAKAASEFDKQLGLLELQIRSTTAALVQDSIPQIARALKDLSGVIQENRSAIDSVGSAIGIVLRDELKADLKTLTGLVSGLAFAWQAVALAVNAAGFGRPAASALANQPGLGTASADVGASLNLPPRQSGGDLSLGAGITRTKAKKGPRSTELNESLKEADLAGREIRQRLDADISENERALRRQGRTIEEFTNRAIDLANQELNATIDKINAEQSAIESGLAKRLITKRQFNIRDKELTLETQVAVQKNDEQISKLEDDRDKQIAAAQLAATERRIRIQEDADHRLIDTIKDRVKQQGGLESEAEKQIADIVEEAFARRKAALEEEQTAYGLTVERRKEIVDELIKLEGERAGAAVEASRKIRDALKAEADARRERDNAIREAAETAALQTTKERARAAAREAAEQVAERTKGFQGQDSGPASAIDQLFGAINEHLTGAKQSAALAGLGAMTTAFQGLGDAVGEAAYAWVLYGNAGKSVRQVTAEILASVAQQAAVKAIFELAEGFAALAMAFFGIPNAGPSASAHFTAAAIYGTIAGVAAVTGRAVAGDSFKQATGTGGGSAGGGASSLAANARPAPTTIKEEWRQTRPIVIQIHGEAGEAFKYKVLGVIDNDFDVNGSTARRIKVETGS